MSCFICSDLHVATVAQWAVSQGIADDAAQAAISLRAANNYAHATRYEGRYPEDRQPLQGLRALLARPMPNQTAAWFHSLARCLQYQCSEGDTLEATPGGRLVAAIAAHAHEAAHGATVDGVWDI
jgi:hypothetical protein